MEVCVESSGDKIKQLRQKAGMTQYELADKLKISPVNISQLENNKRKPSLETLIKLADALGCQLYDLQVKSAHATETMNYWSKSIISAAQLAEEKRTEDDFILRHFGKAVLKSVSQYEILNDVGQEKVRAYIQDLYENPNYRD